MSDCACCSVRPATAAGRVFGLHQLALPPSAVGPAVVAAHGAPFGRRRSGDPAVVTPDVIHSVYGIPRTVPIISKNNSQAIAEFQGQCALVKDNDRFFDLFVRGDTDPAHANFSKVVGSNCPPPAGTEAALDAECAASFFFAHQVFQSIFLFLLGSSV